MWDAGIHGEVMNPNLRNVYLCCNDNLLFILNLQAPEMIARKGYGKAADFWSLGCIFYEMLQGDPPFQSKSGAKDLFRKIMTERVRMPNYASANACKVLKGLLNR